MGEAGELRCSRCHQSKPIDDFHRNAAARQNRGRHSYCKACSRDYDRARYPHGKPRQRLRYLEKTYGLTLATYDELVASQGSRCAICHRAATLVVDHDHETGALRGLLCHRCNRALGLLGDNAAVLASAVAYLAQQGF